MTSQYFYVGAIMILAGLFEMVVAPVMLRRFWIKHAPPRSPSVLRTIRTIRMSGLIVVIVGLSFLVGLFG